MRGESAMKDAFIGITIFALALIFFGAGSGSLSYSSPDEKRYEQSAKEMVRGGDWLTPRYHGRPRFQKPILFYWMAASAMSVFGAGWFAARLPSAACGALGVVFVFFLGRLFFGKKAGIACAALLAVSPLYFIYSRLATPDMASVFFITASLCLFSGMYFKNYSKLKAHLFFASLALGVLTKGLAGIFIPVIIIALFTAVFKKGSVFSKKDIATGIALFLAISLPWFVMMHKAHGGAYAAHIWQVETVGRLADPWRTANEALAGIPKRFLYYLAAAFALLFPSSAFLLGALKGLAGNRVKKEKAFCIIWIASVMVFFTLIGTRKTHYILPLAPPVSLLAGEYAAGILGQKRVYRRVFYGFIAAMLIMYLALFAYILPSLSGEDGLFALSEKVSSVRKEGEEIGVGSHFISHNRVDSYLGMNVKKVNVDLSDPAVQAAVSAKLLSEFLAKKERVFLFIIRGDYERYITDELKKRLYILASGLYWKKPNQIELNAALASSVLRADKEAFNNLVKNEIYLISNRPGDAR